MRWREFIRRVVDDVMFVVMAGLLLAIPFLIVNCI